MQETRVHSLSQEYRPGEGNDSTLQYSCLGNPMDRGAWLATDPGVAKVRLDSACSNTQCLRQYSCIICIIISRMKCNYAHITLDKQGN